MLLSQFLIMAYSFWYVDATAQSLLPSSHGILPVSPSLHMVFIKVCICKVSQGPSLVPNVALLGSGGQFKK